MTNKEKNYLHMVKNGKPNTTPFLSLEEQAFIKGHTKDHILVGGYKNPERKRAALFGADPDLVRVVQITYPKDHLSLSHQKILGNLMGLGIDRDHIGDILVDLDAFVISKELWPFIQVELRHIDQTPVEVEAIDIQDYLYQQAYQDLQVILDSLRLDLLVAKVAKTSREEAKTAIVNGLVKVNHKVLTKPTVKVQEEDVVSIRRYGRILIEDASKRTKKGKILLNYKKYQ